MFWLLVVTLVVILVYSITNRLSYWKNKGVTQHSIGKAFLNIISFLLPRKGIVQNFDEMYNSFPDKKYYGSFQMLKPILLLRDPEMIKQITIKDFEYFTDHIDILPDDGQQFWNKNLFALKGDVWRNMRANLSPSFTSSKLKIIFGLLTDCARQSVDYFEQKSSNVSEIEVKDIFSRFTNDVIATAAFGVSCNSLKHKDNEFYVMGKRLTNVDNIWTTIKMLLLLGLPKQIIAFFSISFFEKGAMNFFTTLIDDTIKSRETHKIVRPDMLNILLEVKNNRTPQEDIIEENSVTHQLHSTVSKPLLTDDDIKAQAFIFFLAGFETTALVMSFMAYEIAVNEKIRQRLQHEIDDIYDECKGNLTYNYLAKMKYMDMVIAETLRLYPIGFAIDRKCVKPYTLRDNENQMSVQLDVGDVIYMPLLSIQRDPKYFEDPLKFWPERFSDENKQKIDSGTYFPFGSGPRHCIGNRFALMETKVLFFYILQKFDIIPIDKTVIPLKMANSKVRLTTEESIWLGLKKRNI